MGLVSIADVMTRRPAFADVDVPPWGGTVRLARLDGPDKLRFALRAEAVTDDDRESYYRFGIDLLAASIIDANGQLEVTTEAGLTWLSGEIEAVGILVPAALRLNGLAAADVASEVEDAEKNSEQLPDAVLPTG